MNEVTSNPITRLTLVILIAYITIPSLFSYTTIKSTLSSYNICFVGPTSTGIKMNKLNNEIQATKNQKLKYAHQYSSQLPLSSSETQPNNDEPSLYGTYQSYRNTNYYFIQRLYPVEEYLFGCTSLLFFGSTSNINSDKKCGWPNGLIISQTLNKQTMKELKDEWIARQKSQNSNLLEQQGFYQTYNPFNTSLVEEHESHNQLVVSENKNKYAIYWDQGHTPFVSGQSRWCLGVASSDHTAQDAHNTLKFCTPELPSIVSDSSHSPYFPELPLNPPPSGSLIWNNPKLNVQCYSNKSAKDDAVTSWDVRVLPSIWIIGLFLISQYNFLYQSSERDRYSYSRVTSNRTSNTASNVKSPWLFPNLYTILVLPYRHLNMPILLWNLYNVYILCITLELRYTSILFLNLFFSISLLNTISSILLGQGYYSTNLQSMFTKPNNNNHYYLLPCGLSPTITTFMVYIMLQYDIYYLLPNVYITSQQILYFNVFFFPVMNCLLQYSLVPKSYYYRFADGGGATSTYPISINRYPQDSGITFTTHELLSSLFISSTLHDGTSSKKHTSNEDDTDEISNNEKHYNIILGHLSGTIWGYVLHTNVIPIQLLMPYIIIPTLILIGYFYQSHVLQQEQVIKLNQQKQQNKKANDENDMELCGMDDTNTSNYHKAYIHERETLLHKETTNDNTNTPLMQPDDYNDSNNVDTTLSMDSSITSHDSSTISSKTNNNSSKISYNTITLMKKIHEKLYTILKVYFYILFLLQFLFLGLGFVVLYDHYKSLSLFIHLYLLYYCFYQFTIHVMYPNFMFYQDDYNFFLEQEERLQEQRRVSNKSLQSSNSAMTLKQRKHYYYSLQLVQYIFNGYILVLLLEFMNDGVTLGTWFVTKSLIMSFYTRTFLVQFTDVLLFWGIKIALNVGSLLCILGMKWILFSVCNEGSGSTSYLIRNRSSRNVGGANTSNVINPNGASGNTSGRTNNSEDSLLLLDNGIGTWILPKIVVLFFE